MVVVVVVVVVVVFVEVVVVVGMGERVGGSRNGHDIENNFLFASIGKEVDCREQATLQ